MQAGTVDTEPDENTGYQLVTDQLIDGITLKVLLFYSLVFKSNIYFSPSRQVFYLFAFKKANKRDRGRSPNPFSRKRNKSSYIQVYRLKAGESVMMYV